MALMINDDCTNCGACQHECPVSAIFESGENPNNKYADDVFFWIDQDICTECEDFHDEPQCRLVCPADAVIPAPIQSV